jgi:ribonuclease HI
MYIEEERRKGITVIESDLPPITTIDPAGWWNIDAIIVGLETTGHSVIQVAATQLEYIEQAGTQTAELLSLNGPPKSTLWDKMIVHTKDPVHHWIAIIRKGPDQFVRIDSNEEPDDPINKARRVNLTASEVKDKYITKQGVILVVETEMKRRLKRAIAACRRKCKGMDNINTQLTQPEYNPTHTMNVKQHPTDTGDSLPGKPDPATRDSKERDTAKHSHKLQPISEWPALHPWQRKKKNTTKGKKKAYASQPTQAPSDPNAAAMEEIGNRLTRTGNDIDWQEEARNFMNNLKDEATNRGNSSTGNQEKEESWGEPHIQTSTTLSIKPTHETKHHELEQNHNRSTPCASDLPQTQSTQHPIDSTQTTPTIPTPTLKQCRPDCTPAKTPKQADTREEQLTQAQQPTSSEEQQGAQGKKDHPYSGYNHENQTRDADMDEEWQGDNMSIREKSAGCRIMFRNPNKCMGTRAAVEREFEYLAEMSTDIATYCEPGFFRDKAAVKHLENHADRKGYVAVTTNPEKGKGILTLINKRWAPTMEKGYPKAINPPSGCPEEANGRIALTQFRSTVKAEGHPGDGWARMALFTLYGHTSDKDITALLIDTLRKEINRYRTKYAFGTVIVATDLNAARIKALDTDRTSEDPEEKEADSYLIDMITGDDSLQESLNGPRANTLDIFRTRHPTCRATTHRSNRTDSANRRIDYIFATAEIAEHPQTRIGIPDQCPLNVATTDPEKETNDYHLPVFIDIPICCTHINPGSIPLWETKYVKKITEVSKSDEAIEAFNLTLTKEHQKNPTQEGITHAIKAAAINTTHKEETIRYPREIGRTLYNDGWGYQLNTWMKRMKGACVALQNPRLRQETIQKSINRAAWQYTDAPCNLVMDTLDNIVYKKGLKARAALRERISSQIREVTIHIKKFRREEAKRKREASKPKAEEKHSLPKDKTQKKVLNSIYRIVSQYREIEWVRKTAPTNEQGEVATSEEEVSQTVALFFEKWMESRISIEERWETKEKMNNLNTEHMPHRFRDFVKECYETPRKEYLRKSKREGWYKDILNPITKEEIDKAIAKSSRDSAPGRSGVTNAMIKNLDQDGREILRAEFNEWLQKREIPDELNTAVIRLLPKTDKGLADLNAVRPIALMECIIKTYEQVIIGRTLSCLVDNGALDLSQYGAIPKAGVFAPLRILAEIINDANEHDKDLHIMVADLSKAFDTMEYWSQEMSWQAIGMPQGMTDILINLDRGGQGEGQGATSCVSLAHGAHTRPFKHGRGVRQGSVGGPLKWVLFVHFWMKWVKTKMRGKGYEMEANHKQRNINSKIRLEPDNWERSEIIGMQFVDDSIWAARTAQAMQEMIALHKTFCEFHKVDLNMKKSEYHSHLNSKSKKAPAQVHWPKEAPQQSDCNRCNQTETMVTLKESETQGNTSIGIKDKTEEPLTPVKEQGDIRSYATKRTRSNAATEQTQTLGMVAEDRGDEPFKYLGVWYSMKGSWKHQISVMDRKHKENIKALRMSKAPLGQIVEAINTKAIPQMLYPLQIATPTRETLKRWDAELRNVVCKAAGWAATGIPRAAFHNKREDMGLGLNSIEDLAYQQRIKLDMLARNDSMLTKIDKDSEQAQITKAAWRSHTPCTNTLGKARQPITPCQAVEQAEEQIKVKIKETPRLKGFYQTTKEDREKALSNTYDDQAHDIYTDGSTLNKGTRSGWGWITYRAEDNTRATPLASKADRLKGDQDNYTAEATAALSAIINTHPATDINLYIDNQAVIMRLDKDHRNDPRARMSGNARATMSRIEAILELRRKEGSKTTVNWIHSHVEDEERAVQESKNSKLSCACGKAKCDPLHKHHKGNDEADALAKQGALSEGGPTQEDPMKGEDAVHLTIEGNLCQGPIRESLAEACTKQREEKARRRYIESGKTEGRLEAAMYDMLRLSNKAMRKKVANNSGAAPMRYWPRAATEQLPTYHHEYKRVKAGSEIYNEMYKNDIEGGLCVACKKPETLQHIMCECEIPRVKQIRTKALREVVKCWGKKPEGNNPKGKKKKRARETIQEKNPSSEEPHQAQDEEQRGKTPTPRNKATARELNPEGWPSRDYITQKHSKEGEGWQQWWAWLGLVPESTVAQVTWAQQKKLADIAVITAKFGHEMWLARVEEIKEREEASGCKARKTEARKRKKQSNSKQGIHKKSPQKDTCNQAKKRKTKPDDLVTPATRKARQIERKTAELTQEGYSPAKARQVAKTALEREETQRTNRTLEGMKFIKTATRKTKQKSARPTKKSLTWGSHLDENEYSAYLDNSTTRGNKEPKLTCGITNCDNDANMNNRPAGCTEPRCHIKAHQIMTCRGINQKCECQKPKKRPQTDNIGPNQDKRPSSDQNPRGRKQRTKDVTSDEEMSEQEENEHPFDRACKVDWDHIITIETEKGKEEMVIVDLLPNHSESPSCPTTIRAINEKGEVDIPISSKAWEVVGKGYDTDTEERRSKIRGAQSELTREQKRRCEWQKLATPRNLLAKTDTRKRREQDRRDEQRKQAKHRPPRPLQTQPESQPVGNADSLTALNSTRSLNEKDNGRREDGEPLAEDSAVPNSLQGGVQIHQVESNQKHGLEHSESGRVDCKKDREKGNKSRQDIPEGRHKERQRDHDRQRRAANPESPTGKDETESNTVDEEKMRRKRAILGTHPPNERNAKAGKTVPNDPNRGNPSPISSRGRDKNGEQSTGEEEIGKGLDTGSNRMGSSSRVDNETSHSQDYNPSEREHNDQRKGGDSNCGTGIRLARGDRGPPESGNEGNTARREETDHSQNRGEEHKSSTRHSETFPVSRPIQGTDHSSSESSKRKHERGADRNMDIPIMQEYVNSPGIPEGKTRSKRPCSREANPLRGHPGDRSDNKGYSDHEKGSTKCPMGNREPREKCYMEDPRGNNSPDLAAVQLTDPEPIATNQPLPASKDKSPTPIPDKEAGREVHQEGTRMRVWQEVRENLQDSDVTGNLQPVQPNPPHRQGIQMRAMQTTQANQTQGARAGSVPCKRRPTTEDNRNRPSGERSSEQSSPRTGRAHRKNYAASMAGEGIPAWLTHKINTHPKAGTEVWVTPATRVAGQRRHNPRESNKRRKAMSATGLTLIIPNQPEGHSGRRARPRRQAAIECADRLTGGDPKRAWGEVEVVIQEECAVPRNIRRRNNKTRGASQAEGEGNLPPQDKSPTREEGGGGPPSKKREPPRGKEGGTPPPPSKRGKEIRGAGPQPGEG